MKAADLSETVDALLARDSDNHQEDRNFESSSLLQPLPYGHERFLVVWVLLTRLPQAELDRVWEKHGNDLDHFAHCLLTNLRDGVDIFARSHEVSNKDGNDFFFQACCTRLIAQVTARLTDIPSKELRRDVYDSWKHISAPETVRNVVETSSSANDEAVILRFTTIPLCVDVYNAFVAWIDHDVPFESDLVLNDLWKIPIMTCTRLTEIVEQEDGEKDQKRPKQKRPKQTPLETKTIMFNVLESVLGMSGENNPGIDGKDDDMYTIANLQRLMFVIFELKGTDCVSLELVKSIVLWRTNSREKILDAEIRILWDGWLLKCIRGRNTEKSNGMNLFRDPEIMDAIQKICMAHAVSPDTNALRPMAWQTISKIMQLHGWKRIDKLSIEASMCTWCQLACGEWKIQLEIDGCSGFSDRLPILDGCGNLIITIVRYLVDLHDRPHKTVPLKMQSILSLRKALEDTLALTSAYLNEKASTADDTESAIIVHLWSELFSEINLTTSEDAGIVIACFKNLLLLSSNDCLLQPLLHVATTYCTEDGFLDDVDRLDNPVTASMTLYLVRFWNSIKTRDLLNICCQYDVIQSACVATEILAESHHERIESVAIAIVDAVELVARSSQQKMRLRESVRLMVDTCIFLSQRFDGSPFIDNISSKISFAIQMVNNS